MATNELTIIVSKAREISPSQVESEGQAIMSRHSIAHNMAGNYPRKSNSYLKNAHSIQTASIRPKSARTYKNPSAFHPDNNGKKKKKMMKTRRIQKKPQATKT